MDWSVFLIMAVQAYVKPCRYTGSKTGDNKTLLLVMIIQGRVIMVYILVARRTPHTEATRISQGSFWPCVNLVSLVGLLKYNN